MGVQHLAGAEWAKAASGAVGLPLAALALYGGLALLIEDTQKRTVLPLFRRGAAQRSIESHIADQLESIEQEAGVRNQL